MLTVGQIFPALWLNIFLPALGLSKIAKNILLQKQQKNPERKKNPLKHQEFSFNEKVLRTQN